MNQNTINHNNKEQTISLAEELVAIESSQQSLLEVEEREGSQLSIEGSSVSMQISNDQKLKSVDKYHGVSQLKCSNSEVKNHVQQLPSTLNVTSTNSPSFMLKLNKKKSHPFQSDKKSSLNSNPHHPEPQFQKNYPKNIFIPLIEYLAEKGYKQAYEECVGTREQIEKKNVVSLDMIFNLTRQPWFERNINPRHVLINISNKILINSKIKKKLFHLLICRYILCEDQTKDLKEFKKQVSKRANSVANELKKQSTDELFGCSNSIIYLLGIFSRVLRESLDSHQKAGMTLSQGQMMFGSYGEVKKNGTNFQNNGNFATPSSTAESVLVVDEKICQNMLGKLKIIDSRSMATSGKQVSPALINTQSNGNNNNIHSMKSPSYSSSINPSIISNQKCTSSPYGSKQEYKILVKQIVHLFARKSLNMNELTDAFENVKNHILGRCGQIQQKYQLGDCIPNWGDFVDIVVRKCFENRRKGMKITNMIFNDWVNQYKVKLSDVGDSSQRDDSGSRDNRVNQVIGRAGKANSELKKSNGEEAVVAEGGDAAVEKKALQVENDGQPSSEMGVKMFEPIILKKNY